MRSGPDLRVLGIAVPDVSDWVRPQPEGKWSQLFRALSERFELVGVIRPDDSSTERYLNYARSFHPLKRNWKARAGFNRGVVTRRTQKVDHELRRYGASCDLIMQLQTLCAPGFDRGGIPYAIYTDNTMALTRRLYPAWASISARRATWWTEFEAGVCRSAKAVFTCSEFARRSVIADYGCSPESVIAVGAGANQAVDALVDKDYACQRALFVGIDFERKGGSVLLDAWPLVRRSVPQAELVIAGPARAPRNDLPSGVSWVGHLNRQDLAELYRSASVFVMPSLFEPWGFVFFEAMGYGLPCVGTSCCAMPEIIEDGITGRLVPKGEIEPLAGALIDLLDDPGKASAMGHAAHAHVLTGNRWGDVVDRMSAHLV